MADHGEQEDQERVAPWFYVLYGTIIQRGSLAPLKVAAMAMADNRLRNVKSPSVWQGNYRSFQQGDASTCRVSPLYGRVILRWPLKPTARPVRTWQLGGLTSGGIRHGRLSQAPLQLTVRP